MKIVILQDRLRLGGTEVQALSVGQHWAAAGHEVRLVAFRPGGELAATPAAKRLQPINLQRSEWGFDWWAPNLLATVEKLAPEVVVAFGREANVKLPRLAALTMKPALVATLRSGRHQPGRYWRTLRAADAVIANARWAGAAAAAKNIAPEKIHVIYSGLARDPRVADPVAARAEWRERAKTPMEAVVFLCVAGFRLGKGQDMLLRAVAQLPKEPAWRLWFAGDGPLIQRCKNLAIELGLKDRVRFAGRVDNPASLYAAADVGVLTSFGEALPNFLIEAQAAGLPVVSTAVGGTTECFEDGKTGLAAPVDEPKALVAVLARALLDTQWRAAAREPAQARARELFDATRNAARWLEVFAELRKK